MVGLYSVCSQPKWCCSPPPRKPIKDWTTAEDEASLGKSRALNAIFNGVDKNVFRRTNTCTSVKEAWDILGVAHAS